MLLKVIMECLRIVLGIVIPLKVRAYMFQNL